MVNKSLQIAKYLKTSKGRKKLAEAIAKPLLRRMNYSSIATRIFREETFSLPQEWLIAVQKILNKSTRLYKMMALGVNFFNRKETIVICKRYLQIRDKNWWPALLGKSDVMDEVLAEEFKK